MQKKKTPDRTRRDSAQQHNQLTSPESEAADTRPTKCTAMNGETSLEKNLAPQQDEQKVKTPSQRQQHKDFMWFC